MAQFHWHANRMPDAVALALLWLLYFFIATPTGWPDGVALFHYHAYRMTGRRGSCFALVTGQLFHCHASTGWPEDVALFHCHAYRMTGQRGSFFALFISIGNLGCIYFIVMPTGLQEGVALLKLHDCMFMSGETEVSFRYYKGQAALGGTFLEKQESFSSTHGRARTRRILRSSKPACA